MKKYIFIDIDGTLLNSKGEVTEGVKHAIEKAKKEGYQIVLCTGRSIRHSVRFQEKCQASSLLIVCSGGQIYNSDEKQFIYQVGIPTESVDKLYQLVESFNIDISFTIEGNDYSNTLDEGNILLTEENYHTVKTGLISRCALSSYDFFSIQKAKKEILKWGIVEIVNESDDIVQGMPLQKVKKSFIEISALGTSKGDSILKVLSLQEGDSYSYAIGNSINDRSMFQAVDCSIAMGNADELTKKSADWVTKGNDEEGVSYAIECILNRDKENESL